MKKILIFISFVMLWSTAYGVAAETNEITPSDAFATADLAERGADLLLETRGIRNVRLLKKRESGLNPMHTYQIEVANIETLILLETKEKLRPMPRVVASPMHYAPEDVEFLGKMIVHEIQKISEAWGIRDYPRDIRHFEGKKATDVFGKNLDLFIKLRTLAGLEEITPNEVFSQLVLAASDVKTILTQIDPAQRFRIDAPKDVPSDMKPSEVFGICLKIRQDINALREHFGLPVVPVAAIAKDDDLSPSDVFVQTRIIIAELNLLKMGTGAVSSTPLAIPVSGKTPADTYRQAVMVRYLLSQVKPLQDMMKQLGK
ncbi:MAG TPA: hypothetical protein DCQ37_20780 [Desulfobacteraceae bacterium]|nr:hypothetical protein [Desulfobacteraceae bacterium]